MRYLQLAECVIHKNAMSQTTEVGITLLKTRFPRTLEDVYNKGRIYLPVGYTDEHAWFTIKDVRIPNQGEWYIRSQGVTEEWKAKTSKNRALIRIILSYLGHSCQKCKKVLPKEEMLHSRDNSIPFYLDGMLCGTCLDDLDVDITSPDDPRRI